MKSTGNVTEKSSKMRTNDMEIKDDLSGRQECGLEWVKTKLEPMEDSLWTVFQQGQQCRYR